MQDIVALVELVQERGLLLGGDCGVVSCLIIDKFLKANGDTCTYLEKEQDCWRGGRR